MTVSGLNTQQKARMRALYLSDEAYDGLHERAKARGYIRDTATVNRGLHKYVEWVTRQQLHDGRPEYVRDMDAELLSQQQSPEWRNGGARRRRAIKLDGDTMVRACVWATKLGLAYPPYKRIMGAPTFYDPEPCMSALLEALGTDWIDIEVVEAE